ncbi:MAG: mechanosensitive ion channel [Chitinophagaceae bacterium]|nr:mechanosensitive ion channel [Chitinophagaceae bacterium]
MNMLDEIFFDNPVKSYLLVATVIIVAVLLKRYLSRYIASLLFLLIKRSSKHIQKSVFVNLVVQPLDSFLVILVSVLAFDRLYFPHRLNIKIYHVTAHDIVESFFIGIIIISFIWFLLRVIDFIAILIQEKVAPLDAPADNQLVLFFKDFFKVFLVTAGMIMVLKFCFNIHIGQLITGLSIVGAALALAAKESLENLIASFIIFFDKPFIAGDLVKVNTFSGYVERIGLRSTRLRTMDKTLVTVPNKQMVDSIVDNSSARDHVRNEIKVELIPQTPSGKIEIVLAGIKNIFLSHPKKIITSTVYLSDVTRNGIVIICEFFTPSQLSIDNVNILKEDIHLDIKKMQEQNNVNSFQANSFTFTTAANQAETDVVKT